MLSIYGYMYVHVFIVHNSYFKISYRNRLLSSKKIESWGKAMLNADFDDLVPLTSILWTLSLKYGQRSSRIRPATPWWRSFLARESIMEHTIKCCEKVADSRLNQLWKETTSMLLYCHSFIHSQRLPYEFIIYLSVW